ncbi:bifunctional acetate--CoA ligase family protein/GNAT family N-acetyltransferase, partial [Duganella callida]
HTGALAGADAVYDAALRRAGMLRVFSTEELFDAVETLARAQPLGGERLAIITNGGGPGVMATDALICQHGRLATLSAASVAQLDALLPPTWSRANPVDLIGDAGAERYQQALDVVLHDELADAVLLLHAPTAVASSTAIATALAPRLHHSGRNVLACWLGGATVAPARRIFAQAGVPSYDTPEDAIGGFMQMVQYRRNQQLLVEVPPAQAPGGAAPHDLARAMVDAALAQRRPLSEPEAKTLLAAYGIPVVDTRLAATVDEALAAAREIGYPVALKIVSPDITHKSDVGGVALDLESPDMLRTAAAAMARRLRQAHPAASLRGYAVQAMARRPQAHELIVGVSTDPVFGPVILFGQGGTAVEVTADHAVGLPPLNQVLARDLVARTRVAKLLAGYRGRPPADLDAICRVLLQVSQLVSDLAEITELDINPLLADSQGVIALDARISLAATTLRGVDRLAIRPYPTELEQRLMWQGQPLLLRPIRPEDASAHLAFFHALSPEDVRYRTFISQRELAPSQLARLTQIDYDREMALIATRQRPDGSAETLGVARAVADPDNVDAEFAIIVRSDLQRRGLGAILLGSLIAYCRARGTQRLVGESLRANLGMQRLAQRHGFAVLPGADAASVALRLALAPANAEAPA